MEASALSSVFSKGPARRQGGEPMKKLSDWVPLVGGAMVAFILFAWLWKAFDVHVGPQAGSPFMQASIQQAEKVRKILPSSSSSSSLSSLSSLKLSSPPSRPSSTSMQVSMQEVSSLSPSPLSSTSTGLSVSWPSLLVSGESVPFDFLLNNANIPHEYMLGRRPIPDWDTDRQLWLASHPNKQNYTNHGKPRLFMLTGSQPPPCRGNKGDYLMLKSFKNKVDYCMLHDVQIFFNSAILDKNMDSFWAKLPLIRASMEAHPEAEWFWWVDSDVVITDMLFELPLHTYGQYNLVVHGWETEVYEKKSVMGLNAGSFLVRNCGWSMRFMDRWASMGPKGPIRDLAGRLQSALLSDRPPDYPGDDQAALIYFMIKEHHLWGDKILLERSYNLNGYWLDIVGNMEIIEAKEHEDKSATNGEISKSRLERPFVTHFAGCQPCTGNRNPAFKEHQCEHEMERALNFADNQVLLSMGFRHPSLNSLDVEPLP